ncbi:MULTISPECIES: hypothetical protein [Nocardiopsis]|uniref:hypothetical protein n=1 Tax=Nocardiopsis TaxID=2013 RepID=UPI00034D7A69|nr:MULTISPECIES: hypothetical protein [Nocardiopsis]
MRHFVGFFVGLLLAPLVVFGVGWAQPRLAALNGAGGTFAGPAGAVTAGGLCALALVVAVVLVGPRLTPLLPGIAGLTLMAASATAVLRPGLADRVPGWVPGQEGALSLLELGVFLPLAVLLVAPLMVPSRWVREEHGGVSPDEYFDGLYDEDYEDGGAAGAQRRPAV